MNAAPCSWRTMTISIGESRRASTISRVSSPGIAKMRSTPSDSRQRTISSAACSVASPLPGSGARGGPEGYPRRLRHGPPGEEVTHGDSQPGPRPGAAHGAAAGWSASTSVRRGPRRRQPVHRRDHRARWPSAGPTDVASAVADALRHLPPPPAGRARRRAGARRAPGGRARRDLRAHHLPRGRQADEAGARRGRALRGHADLLGRGGAHAGRRGRADGVQLRRRRQARDDPARADRRGGGDLALQLPAQPGGPQAGARPSRPAARWC